MRYADGSYDSPEWTYRQAPPDQRAFPQESVCEAELGFRIGDYWLAILEDEHDIAWFAEQARLEAMLKDPQEPFAFGA